MSKKTRTHTPKYKAIKTIDDLTAWLNRRLSRTLGEQKRRKQRHYGFQFNEHSTLFANYSGHAGRKRNR